MRVVRVGTYYLYRYSSGNPIDQFFVLGYYIIMCMVLLTYSPKSLLYNIIKNNYFRINNNNITHESPWCIRFQGKRRLTAGLELDRRGTAMSEKKYYNQWRGEAVFCTVVVVIVVCTVYAAFRLCTDTIVLREIDFLCDPLWYRICEMDTVSGKNR